MARRLVPDPDAGIARLGGAARRARRSPTRPAFVVDDQMVGGRQGRRGARARRCPIFVFSDDPRGIAFLDDSARFVGHDARHHRRGTALAADRGELAALFREPRTRRNSRLRPRRARRRGLALVPAQA